jgi:aryl carrier-like protein
VATAPTEIAPALDELSDDWFEPQTISVETRTLSDVIHELGVDRIDLLKVDVERSELDVLEGIDEGDWHRIQQVVMEVEDSEGRLDAIGRLLTARGFDLVTERSRAFRGTRLHNVHASRPLATKQTASTARRHEVVPEAADLSAAALRQFLAARLPRYMIPATYSVVDEFPLTITGKIDRSALQQLSGARAGQQPDSRPLSAIEQQLAVLWRELLHVDRVGLHDNLFDMGADSLLVMQAHQRISRTLNDQLTIVDMYRYPTIAELAAFLVPHQAGTVDGASDTVRERSERRRHWADEQRRRRQPEGMAEQGS